MDNPTRWNITNSAQNIVSALVDSSKQYDHVFRREWNNTFAGFSKYRPTSKTRLDSELKSKLADYLAKLETRRSIKAYEKDYEVRSNDQVSKDGIVSIVPDIFMKEDFDLSNLDTFNTVILARLSCDTKEEDLLNDSSIEDFEHRNQKLITKSQLKELQQNLTDYLDVIEEQLACQISSRSGDFFQVMSSVDSVMDELSRAIKSVTHLRRKCTKLNEDMMLPNMKSIHINKTRCNAQSVLDKMNDIAYLCKVQPMIQILLSASDFVGALDLIAKSRVMLHKDLTRVVGLRYMELQLNEIERMIGTMMQQEFLTLISSEWDGTLNQQTSAASRLSKLFDYFANGHSEIPDRGSLTLLSLLQIQAEKFVNQFHEERKKRLESSLDIEQWKVVEVPKDFQKLITMIIDERVQIGEIFSGENLQRLSHSGGMARNTSGASLNSQSRSVTQNGSNISHKNSAERIKLTCSSDNLATMITNQTDSSSNRGEHHVKVAGCTFVIVVSVINLLRTIMDYCKCAHDIRSLSADLLERLFEILALYNSKAYHPVYSTTIVQSAGSKTITTRSLIVSQRSLKLINLFIPAIQKHFVQLLPNDNRLRRFDKIKASYQEHIGKIPERVNSTVGDVINLQLQEWEAKPPVPSSQFTSVAQHLIRLHDNIQDILPGDEMRSLFRRMNNTFKQVLVKHLRRLNIKNDAGPQQWLVMQELTFYKISLLKLNTLDDSELSFDDLWSSLDIEPQQSTKDQADILR